MINRIHTGAILAGIVIGLPAIVAWLVIAIVCTLVGTCAFLMVAIWLAGVSKLTGFKFWQ